MSEWDFDEAGRFGSQRAAEEFAKRNKFDLRDIRTCVPGEGVELEIRRNAVDRGTLRVTGEGRRDGWS